MSYSSCLSFDHVASSNSVIFLYYQIATNPKCNPKTWASYSKICCTDDANEPCGLGEGDCDTDEECAGDLVCGTNNCLPMGSGLKTRSDCCELPVIKGMFLSVVEEGNYFQLAKIMIRLTWNYLHFYRIW